MVHGPLDLGPKNVKGRQEQSWEFWKTSKLPAFSSVQI